MLNMNDKVIRTIFVIIYFSFSAMIVISANDEFKPLLSGDSLEGWESIGPAKWTLTSGTLTTGQDGDPKRWGILQTKKRYLDLELMLEFKIDEHGKYNSGVYLRRPVSGKKGKAYQVNIGRGASGEPIGLYLNDWLSKGDEQDKIRIPLKWNKLHIRIIKSRIQVWLNKKEIVNFNHKDPKPYLLEPGTIALQTYGAEGHSGWVKFRKLKIKELSKY